MTELGSPTARRSWGTARVIDLIAYSWRRPAVLSRLVVGLALIAGGIVWAIARGLVFYGLTPADVGYDLDQPPLLLTLVGVWLLYRSRER